jgi:hypothetical protein
MAESEYRSFSEAGLKRHFYGIAVGLRKQLERKFQARLIEREVEIEASIKSQYEESSANEVAAIRRRLQDDYNASLQQKDDEIRASVSAAYQNELVRLQAENTRLRGEFSHKLFERYINGVGWIHSWLRVRPCSSSEKPIEGFETQRDQVKLNGELHELQYIFGPEADSGNVQAGMATNEEIGKKWQTTVHEAIKDDIDLLLVAYGETGSGKTHTMLGKPLTRDNVNLTQSMAAPAAQQVGTNMNGNEEGLIPRTVRYLLAENYKVDALTLKIDGNKIEDIMLPGEPEPKRFCGKAVVTDCTNKIQHPLRLRYMKQDGSVDDSLQPYSFTDDKNINKWLGYIRERRVQTDTTIIESKIRQHTDTYMPTGNHTSSRTQLLVIIHIKTQTGDLVRRIWMADMAGYEDSDPKFDGDRKRQSIVFSRDLGEMKAISEEVNKIAKSNESYTKHAKRWDRFREGSGIRTNTSVSCIPPLPSNMLLPTEAELRSL